MKWPRTFGFGAIQITAGLLIQLWCWSVHNRFRYLHQGGHGRGLSNVYWDYSWVYTAFAISLFVLAIVWHRKRQVTLYESTIHFGYWLLAVWTGFAVIAMEISFVPDVNLRGEDW